MWSSVKPFFKYTNNNKDDRLHSISYSYQLAQYQLNNRFVTDQKNIHSAPDSFSLFDSSITQFAFAMRNLSSPSTPSSSKKESLIPMWDSSDPSRNPPPMPLQPDSPNLNATSVTGNIVSNSPFKLNSSPIRQPFHTRGSSSYTSINEDRLQEILENSRDTKTQLNIIQDSVQNAMKESGSLTNRSKDNATTLTSLIEASQDTKAVSEKASESIRETLPLILSSIDSERESHKAMSTTLNVLLEQNRDVHRRFQTQEANVGRLINLSESLETNQQKGGGLVTREDLDRVMNRKNTNILEELSTFSDNISGQQQQVVTLLRGLKDHFEFSTKSHDKLFSAIGRESECIVGELEKVIKKTQEVNNQQINSLPQRISELEDCLTAVLDKAVFNITSKAVSLNDNAIIQISAELKNIMTNLIRHRDENYELQNKKHDALFDKIEHLIKDENYERQNIIESLVETNSKHLLNSMKTQDEETRGVLNLGFSDITDKLDRINDEINSVEKTREIEEKKREIKHTNDTKELLDDVLKQVSKEVALNTDLLKDTLSDSNNKINKISQRVDDVASSYDQLTKTLPPETLRSIEELLKTDVSNKLKAINSQNSETQDELQTGFSDMNRTLSKITEIVEDKTSKIQEQDAENLQQVTVLLNRNMEGILDKIERVEKTNKNEHESKMTQRIEELEQLLKSSVERAEKAESRAQVAENKLATANEQLKSKVEAHRLELQSLKYFELDISRHEKKIESLESETDKLREEKYKLQQQLGGLNSVYYIRLEELEKLETRVEAFERRLSQAILNRSKGILGSTTMTIINSNSHQHHLQSHKSRELHSSSRNTHTLETGSRSNSTSSNSSFNNCDSYSHDNDVKGHHTGNSRRHFSLAPDSIDKGMTIYNSDSEDGKENELGTGTLVMKKQRGKEHKNSGDLYGSSMTKHRSISLFTPGEVSD